MEQTIHFARVQSSHKRVISFPFHFIPIPGKTRDRAEPRETATTVLGGDGARLTFLGQLQKTNPHFSTTTPFPPETDGCN